MKNKRVKEQEICSVELKSVKISRVIRIPKGKLIDYLVNAEKEVFAV